MLSILLAPAVAETGEGSGAGGYADKFNMRSITVPAVAFGAAVVSTPTGTNLKVWSLANSSVQARHALTTDSTFSWTTGRERFSHLLFYHAIIKEVSAWSQAEQKQLVDWWNGYVLSNTPPQAGSFSQTKLTLNPNMLPTLFIFTHPILPFTAESCRDSGEDLA